MPRRKSVLTDPLYQAALQAVTSENPLLQALRDIYGLDVSRLRRTASSSKFASTSSETGFSSEILTFIERVADKLTNPKGLPLTPEQQARVDKVKEQIRKDLLDVLEGRKDLAEWFTTTRQNFNLKSYELAEIIYQSLEGLRSKEAQDLRDQWLQFIIAERRGYGLTP
jgi:hypothetical protein